MSNIYSKLEKCGFGIHWANGNLDEGSITTVCKHFDLDKAMIPNKQFGPICVFCAHILDTYKEQSQTNTNKLVKEIETY